MQVICLAVQIYWGICIARIIFSFIPVEGGGVLASIQGFVYNLTEPVFSVVRQALPRPGDLPIDLSPIVVFIVLGIIQRIVCG